VLLDFHTLTTASDGALSPVQLLQRACERKVEILAVTDHDTVAGYSQARDWLAAQAPTSAPSLRLLPGIEFSCAWSGVTIHVVGLGIDIEHPALRVGLAVLSCARIERGRKIAKRLESRGFDNALSGAMAQAGESQLGRPHFATWMVNEGHVEDHSEAFDRYLGRGKMGDVKAFWPSLQEVTRWIVAAGGSAVVAHPGKYRLTGMKLRRLLIDFVAAGGTAIEIFSGRQSPDHLAQVRRMVKEFDLHVSVGSDFHREGKYHPDLGVDISAINNIKKKSERLL